MKTLMTICTIFFVQQVSAHTWHCDKNARTIEQEAIMELLIDYKDKYLEYIQVAGFACFEIRLANGKPVLIKRKRFVAAVIKESNDHHHRDHRSKK